jgi:hypothetical protein
MSEFEFEFENRTPKRSRAQPHTIYERVSPSFNNTSSPLNLSELGRQSPLINNQRFKDINSPSLRKKYFECEPRQMLNQKGKIVDLLNEFAATYLKQFGN